MKNDNEKPGFLESLAQLLEKNRENKPLIMIIGVTLTLLGKVSNPELLDVVLDAAILVSVIYLIMQKEK